MVIGSSLPFVEIYRPKTRSSLLGNAGVIEKVYNFIANFSKDAKIKAVLLVGPPGVGKTTLAEVLARDFNFELIEFNASDSRKKSDMESLISPVTISNPLEFLEENRRGRIVLVDEVDGIHGNFDRGGVPALKKIATETIYPLIMTANNPESKQVQELKKVSHFYEMSRIGEFPLMEFLETVATQEKAKNPEISIVEDDLQIIAESASGDIRAALNDLQSYFHAQDNPVIVIQRDRTKAMKDIINDIFNAKNQEQAREAVDRKTSEYPMLLNYLADLAYLECRTSEEVYNVYRQIANADRVFQRIIYTQNYNLLRYFFEFLSLGLFYSRERRRRKNLTYLTSLPKVYFALGRYKQKNRAALTIAPKAIRKLHISTQRFVHQEFPSLLKMFKGKTGALIAAWMDLTDDEITMVTKLNGDKLVSTHIEEARTVIGSGRIEAGKDLGKKLNNAELEKFISDSLFEAPLYSLQKKTKKRSKKKKLQVKKSKVTKTKAERETINGDPQKAKKDEQGALTDFF